jgi:sec-independent protein translocase protein TatA
MAGHLQCIAFISMPGTGEWLVILFIGLLIFGRRLPEVARSLGKSVNEFKKGLRDFQESADDVVSDVNKIKNDVVNDVASEVKDAAGEDSPYTGSSDYHYDSGESVNDTTTTESQPATEPAQTPGPIDQPPSVDNVEPMK